MRGRSSGARGSRALCLPLPVVAKETLNAAALGRRQQQREEEVLKKERNVMWRTVAGAPITSAVPLRSLELKHTSLLAGGGGGKASNSYTIVQSPVQDRALGGWVASIAVRILSLVYSYGLFYYDLFRKRR
ncbi:hypothetical protein B296_00026065 [Ensete ventricosum]|uniref:Uncharacterized protein n=1 Tax=Ensete ventricosum TaxID=4639 RepID=A0A427A1X4_ENSVE|nr:hypothetical protein B296_00026065 [Ensete ventricosum]